MIENVYRRYPELQRETARSVAHGWANQVWIIGERLVFRFPRTEDSRQELLREMQVLPKLAAACTVRVPEFLYRSELEEEVMYVGYAQIPGEPLTAELFALLTSQEKSELAVTLGSFLTTLHRETPEVCLPIVGRASWEAFYQEIERNVFPLLSPAEQEWTRELFAAYLQEPANAAYRPRMLHGDLCSDHLLAASGRLCGVIDFGDLRIGDPAYDFVGLYVEYGAEFTKQVLAHYELEPDARFWQRVSGFYVQRLPFHHILYGLESGQEEHVQAGLDQLRKRQNQGRAARKVKDRIMRND